MSDYGECVVAVTPEGLRIDHADPRVLISAEVVHDLRAGVILRGSPHITLNGDLLRIEAVNRTVIYRIGEKTIDRFAYVAEWPD